MRYEHGDPEQRGKYDSLNQSIHQNHTDEQNDRLEVSEEQGQFLSNTGESIKHQLA